MTTGFQVPHEQLIEKIAEQFKNNEKFKPPAWAPFVKTGIHREYAPMNDDWWYRRVASIFRKIYINGPIGIERLANSYGGTRDRGSKPNRVRKGSRAIVRNGIHQLVKAGLVLPYRNKGHIISPEGRKLIDNLSHKIMLEIVKMRPEMVKYLQNPKVQK